MKWLWGHAPLITVFRSRGKRVSEFEGSLVLCRPVNERYQVSLENGASPPPFSAVLRLEHKGLGHAGHLLCLPAASLSLAPWIPNHSLSPKAGN